MKPLFARWMSDELGATAVEFVLIATGISVAIFTLINGLAPN